MKLITLIIVVVMSLLLMGCLSTDRMNESGNGVMVDECIQPPTLVSFPVNSEWTGGDRSQELLILNDWEFQAQIPTIASNDSTTSLVFREKELWVLTSATRNILRYNTETKQWTEYATIGGNEISVKQLYVSRDGTLWAVNNSAEDRSVLSKYEPKIDGFEFVTDNNHLLIGADSRTNPNVIEGQNGKLWLILNVDSEEILVSFDPNTLETKRYKLSPEQASISTFALIEGGGFWLFDKRNKQVMSYETLTTELTKYSGSSSADDISNDSLQHISIFYLDRSERLWIEDRGWFEFDEDFVPVWNKLIRSPVFITDEGPYFNQYVWLRPHYIFEGSNGLFWFTDTKGIVRFNQEIGDWCRFTNRSSPVIEDNNGVLWIVIGGMVYKN